ncbi:uncharacterized protein LOC142818098 isoform X1 [Rhipicephalus microplus]|uniref:uncharacterized protein LOC142818098 isoform X1 n=1 Tax=Rhipicephalus microplus TaxID=6941 RepID=UPI003F6D084A
MLLSHCVQQGRRYSSSFALPPCVRCSEVSLLHNAATLSTSINFATSLAGLNCNRHQCPTANTNEESWSFVGAGEHNSVSESPEVKQDQRSEVICCTCKQVVL